MEEESLKSVSAWLLEALQHHPFPAAPSNTILSSALRTTFSGSRKDNCGWMQSPPTHNPSHLKNLNCHSS